MSFEPSFPVGEVVSNKQLYTEFKCGNMGGMRRSKRLNCLVLICDHTKPLYDDKWEGDVLHYTGMGKIGDQEIDRSQNKTLAESKVNGVDVHLFEVSSPGMYHYRGRVELTEIPYAAKQQDDEGKVRNVWMFPIRLI